MFRFSIRDLFWLTLVAAMVVAMYLEHRRVEAAEVREEAAGKDGLKWKDEWLKWKDHVATIQEQLPRFGLGIFWFTEKPTVMAEPSKPIPASSLFPPAGQP
jgi:hypothetical protein